MPPLPPISLPQLTDLETIERAVDPRSLERGRRYARNGHVLSVDLDQAGQTAAGRVLGSAGRVYQCVVQGVPTEAGAPDLVGHCSCPVGYNCKHVAALLLVLAERDPRPVPPDQGAQPLPRPLEGWLNRAQRLTGEVAREDSHYRLLYLIRPSEKYGLRTTSVQGIKARALKEGGWGKPYAFNILGGSRADFITREDHRIMALLQASEESRYEPRQGHLEGDMGGDVMEAIVRSGRGYYVDQDGLAPDGPALRFAGPLPGKLIWRLQEDAKLRVTLEAERPGLALLALRPPWYLDPSSGDCGPLETGLDDREAALLAAAPAVPAEMAEAFGQAAELRIPDLRLPIPGPPARETVPSEPPTPCLNLRSEDLAQSEAARHWGLTRDPQWVHAAFLTFDYGGLMADPRDGQARIQRVEGGRLLVAERDRAAERAAIQRLEHLGFTKPLEPSEQPGLCLELPDDAAWMHLVVRELPLLGAEGWRIQIDESFRFRLAETGDWELDIDPSEGGRWLDVGLGIEVDGTRIDLLPVLVRMIQAQAGRFSAQNLAAMDEEAELPLRLDDGRLLMMPAQRLRPILATLVELYDPERPLSANGRVRLSHLQSAQLAELEDADPELRWRGGESARDWGRRLKSFQGLAEVAPPEVAPPEALEAELRPYQREGLDWLQFLREYGLGGVLADDMGLGKTVQTLAHLLAEKAGGRADRPSLVVAPTSLMFNWRREAQRFAPSLKVLLLHGADRRKRFEAAAEQDLVLTTYPLLPRDVDALARQEWHLLILDEAQAIKNPRSKAAQAARQLQARHRLCLTGTPLENHLGELWSLLDFLMPDVLGDERRFRRLFRTPIERHGDVERSEQLRRRIAPFLLRRTKDAVASDLPPKTEILREVPLAQDQRDLYETLRLALHEKVRAEVKRKGLSQSGIIILDALLKLRQVCCDPRLVSLESARAVKGSAKLELLLALLPELLDEGRRILLFSQFTSMLDLIQGALMELGMRENRDFVKLTGRTRNRALPVDRFQAGEVPLFLISLKAGGSGLNLTAADTVIHYDPWWNPAAERQATDRAHRIGQDKPVFVYKLLTEGTVEQRVAELQARKQALADAMLAGGGAAAGSLSADDLDLLFAPIVD
ncbi:SNF2-related protein [Thiorhodococcus minor]|uniref:Helicase SNF2 n=1 Tax=Thiorhodococcus minor TaxID=57489 RepID=A0A6M0JUL8_9GAMM|nr:SNF2-related protein [Thiorhodococcus minor]NEV60774.1 helicase SNF2 [Thiorhodococcus minor]